VTERSGSSSELALAANDYRQLSGYVFERLVTGTNARRYWYGPRVAVVYTPVDDTDIRKMVQLALCKLDIATNPGLASQTIGSWTEQYTQAGQASPEELRADILGRLREGGMTVIG
jgi:hypothetical protein